MTSLYGTVSLFGRSTVTRKPACSSRACASSGDSLRMSGIGTGGGPRDTTSRTRVLSPVNDPPAGLCSMTMPFGSSAWRWMVVTVSPSVATRIFALSRLNPTTDGTATVPPPPVREREAAGDQRGDDREHDDERHEPLRTGLARFVQRDGRRLVRRRPPARPGRTTASTTPPICVGSTTPPPSAPSPASTSGCGGGNARARRRRARRPSWPRRDSARRDRAGRRAR